MSREKNILESVKADMDFLGQCLDQIPEFQLVLDSPVIKTSEKLIMVKQSIGDQIHPLTLSFINLVFNNKRESYLGSILRYFMYLYNKEMGIRPAVLLSARSFDPLLREKILRTISQKLHIKIDLQEQTESQLIGGFIMRIEDYQIDASVASQLTKIKKELTH